MKRNFAHPKILAILFIIALFGLNIQPIAAAGPQITSLSPAAQPAAGG